MQGFGGWGWGFYPGQFYPPPYNYPMGGYGPYYGGGYPQSSPYGGGYPQPSATDELNYLKDHLSALEEEMKAVRSRINELESEGK